MFLQSILWIDSPFQVGIVFCICICICMYICINWFTFSAQDRAKWCRVVAGVDASESVNLDDNVDHKPSSSKITIIIMVVCIPYYSEQGAAGDASNKGEMSPWALTLHAPDANRIFSELIFATLNKIRNKFENTLRRCVTLCLQIWHAKKVIVKNVVYCGFQWTFLKHTPESTAHQLICFTEPKLAPYAAHKAMNFAKNQIGYWI